MIEDRGEVYGDGVNIAARLEAAAEPGGICISGGVYEQLLGKSNFPFSEGGEVELKNINRPVRIYRWQPDVEAAGPIVVESRALKRPSIAVLALVNMSNDPDQEFLGDGITEDLITALSRIRSFRVISRESTFSYKGASVDVRQIARELDVRFVLEGSVRKSGNRVRVTVQFIAAALEPELNAFERERALRKPPENLDAWELYQRALWHMWSYEKDRNEKAMELFRQSIAADPGFASSHAYYAYCCYQTVIMGYTEDPEARLEEGMRAARQALQCDDKDAVSYFAIGRIHMMQGNHDAAIAALRKSIELNPCFAQAYHGLGFALSLAGEFEESARCTRKAVEISPRDPMLWAFTIVHALNFILSGDNEAALEWANRALQYPNATGYWVHAVKASALANLGRVDEGRDALASAVEAKPDLSIAFLHDNLPTRETGGLEPYLQGLRACGLE